MDQHEKTALGLELYRIAAGKPGRGLPVLERVLDICGKFVEDDSGARLRRQLKGLQGLMTDWTREEGWWSHGVDYENLREKLNTRIDHILEATVSAAPARSHSRVGMAMAGLRSA